jgi:hypothetical protein
MEQKYLQFTKFIAGEGAGDSTANIQYLELCVVVASFSICNELVLPY